MAWLVTRAATQAALAAHLRLVVGSMRPNPAHRSDPNVEPVWLDGGGRLLKVSLRIRASAAAAMLLAAGLAALIPTFSAAEGVAAVVAVLTWNAWIIGTCAAAVGIQRARRALDPSRPATPTG